MTEPKTLAEWIEKAKSPDAADRKSVNAKLVEFGFHPPTFVRWDAEKKANEVWKHLNEGGGESEEEEPTEKVEKKAAKKSAKPKKAAAATSSGDGGGGSVDLSEVTEALTALTKATAALTKKVDDLSENADIQREYLLEVHTMMNVLISSDQDAKNNLDDLANHFHGKLLGFEEEGSEEG